MNRKYIYYNIMTNVDEKYNDIYWQLSSLESGLYTAICYNQNGFKSFIKDLDPNEYLLDNIQMEMCFSPERFPKMYPCVVQIWSHFEGSMIYVDCNYSIPLNIENFTGNVILKRDVNKYYIGITNEQQEKNLTEISEFAFRELLEITKKE